MGKLNKPAMILCLNLNAAIDKTIIVASFEVDKIHRPESVISLAGGKGCNVARAIKILGEARVVTGWIGGFAGRFIETRLHEEGIQSDFIYIDFESRTCTSILDREMGTMTEIYEAGEIVPQRKIDELRDHIQTDVGKYEAITLSGSLPPGVAPDFYAGIIEIAREAGVPTFLDTSGEALRKGVEAGPLFVKPNENEVKSLLGVERNVPLDFVQAAGEISTKYETNVLLTLGAKGAIAARKQETVLVGIPTVKAKSAVGSGECVLAGLVHGILHGVSFEETVTYGVAAGTANTLSVGAGRFKIEDFERLRGQVQILRR